MYIMYNSEQDYLDDIAALNRRIEYLKTENEFLKREVKRLGARKRKAAPKQPDDIKDCKRVRDGDG